MNFPLQKSARRRKAASVEPSYAPLNDWCRMSGMSRSATYRELANGNLRAIKLASRTLIDVQHGLEWLRSLPAAEFRAPKEAA